MKLPLAPPDAKKILENLSPDTMARLFLARPTALVNGEYLHWDQLRHRSPPDGFSIEHWWFGIKMARQGLLQSLPLLDKLGQPFVFGVPEPLLIHLHHIDQDAAGHIRFESEVATPGNRDRYLLQSLVEEAITSSQLEGASTTRRVAEAMLQEGRQPRDHSERMIFNNFRTMQAIQGLRAQAITPETVLSLHSLLTENTLHDSADAGRLRRSDDVRVVDNRDDTILHQPPSHTELPERLQRLCGFANADENARPFVHPVLRAILLHFMIGYDHPFADGNGRTARALFYWAMARNGYWLTEFTSISHFLRKAPAQYVRAYLHTESDGGDTTYFLFHQLETMRKAITALHDYLARKTQKQRSTELLLAASPELRAELNHRQIDALTHALKYPGASYRIDSHQRNYGVVYQTARADLLALAQLGLLDQIRSGRAFLFIAPADLEQRIADAAKRKA
ncbi:Fic family protein [Candidatus Methylospira mobilis]|uniref:Fic family protein n=1 Tax=Candidatus Methylospira mobilis TaxID=1808979 RepID=UPI0028E578F0|nr:Fic family protein [Candidatus Methylospira mobilis]WNV05794.1 Fic family protein [Candidatus Methylospira mobilis]